MTDQPPTPPTTWCDTCRSWRHVTPCGRDDCPYPAIAEIERLRSALSSCRAAYGQEHADLLDWEAKVREVESELEAAERSRDALKEELAAAQQEREKAMREFCGWLSADIEELHHVEVPRLAESLGRFLAALGASR